MAAKDKEAAAHENTLLRDEMRAVEELMKQELDTAHDALELLKHQLLDCQHALSQTDTRVQHLSAACENAQEQGAAERQGREVVQLQLDAVNRECDNLKMSLVDRDTMAEVERGTFKDELQHQRARHELVERDLKREISDFKCQVEALKMDNDMLRSSANAMATQLDSLAAAMSYQAHTPALPHSQHKTPAFLRVNMPARPSVTMAEEVGGVGMDLGDGSVGAEAADVEKFGDQVWGDWETPRRRLRPGPPVSFTPHAPTGDEAGFEEDGVGERANVEVARESHLDVVRRLLQNSRTGDAAGTPAIKGGRGGGGGSWVRVPGEMDGSRLQQVVMLMMHQYPHTHTRLRHPRHVKEDSSRSSSREQ